MRDHTIRAAFHKNVLKKAHLDTNTIVLDELGLKNGIVRADIAVLNGKLVGYEIKGERDTLLRLNSQVNAYSEVFEKAYVVISEKHLNKVLKLIPEWWGIYCIITDNTGGITFDCERSATRNEERNIYGIAQLLWRVEAAEVLSNIYNRKIKQNHTRHHLYEMLSEECNADEMANIALSYLKRRQDWRISQPLLW